MPHTSRSKDGRRVVLDRRFWAKEKKAIDKARAKRRKKVKDVHAAIEASEVTDNNPVQIEPPSSTQVIAEPSVVREEVLVDQEIDEPLSRTRHESRRQSRCLPVLTNQPQAQGKGEDVPNLYTGMYFGHVIGQWQKLIDISTTLSNRFQDQQASTFGRSLGR